MLGCGVAGTPPSPIDPTPVPPPPAPANNPPRVLGITASTDRIEVGEEVTLTASVSDDETAVDDLTYQWTAPVGVISGTGRVVRWTAPIDQPMPATYTVALVVIDRYTSNGQPLEHRVTAQAPDVHVDNSPASMRALSLSFLEDFTNNSASPEYCVRTFSDSCKGKEAERRDIVDVRRDYEVLSKKLGTPRVELNRTRTAGSVFVSCEFTSRRKSTNSIVVATGTCELKMVNESYRWWLCDSSMHAGNTAALTFPF